MVYLKLLGLVSVIVVERDDWQPGMDDRERKNALEEVMKVASALEGQGAKVRPILDPVVRLGSGKRKLVTEGANEEQNGMERGLGAHTNLSDLIPIRAALEAGEIPVVAPLALDSFSRMVRVDANDVVSALVKGMVAAGRNALPTGPSSASETPPENDDPNAVDLTPLRLMITNREGGIPSYAHQGLPHPSIQLSSEHRHIQRTFHPSWVNSHPTSLDNLSLSQDCLKHMPPASSAIIVSH